MNHANRRVTFIAVAAIICCKWVLAFFGPKEEAEAIKQRLRTFLLEELKLNLSEEKTLITHTRDSAAKFLNYEITTLQCVVLTRKVGEGKVGREGFPGEGQGHAERETNIHQGI
jgi:hypothetical protein